MSEAGPTVEAGGASIPRLGLGTWKTSGQECADIVEKALNVGYRHIDTAQEYENERKVGEGIAAADVEREAIFVTTKVNLENLLNDAVVDSVHDSLDRLDLDYIDLLLIHGPHPRMSIGDKLIAMEELREDGLVNHLGVSNFSRSLLEIAIKTADAPIVTNQVRYHPYKDQSDLLAFCRDHDVALTAYSPLARGGVLDDETLASMGDRHDKTRAQVTLRWLLQKEGVIAIPKTTNPDHLEENLAVFDFELTESEVSRIDGLKPNLRQRLAYGIKARMLRVVSFMWNR